MEDWSEPLINAKKMLKEIEDAANDKNYETARKIASYTIDELLVMRFILATMVNK